MPFPKRYAEAAARWRVKAGFVVIAIFFWLARPTWTSLAAGASIGLCGMALRAWAAGHLAKNERLTTSGPFARVRNPLYLGSLTVGVAFAIGSAHAGVAVLLLSSSCPWWKKKRRTYASSSLTTPTTPRASRGCSPGGQERSDQSSAFASRSTTRTGSTKPYWASWRAFSCLS